jgi:hypothetical protein
MPGTKLYLIRNTQGTKNTCCRGVEDRGLRRRESAICADSRIQCTCIVKVPIEDRSACYRVLNSWEDATEDLYIKSSLKSSSHRGRTTVVYYLVSYLFFTRACQHFWDTPTHIHTYLNIMLHDVPCPPSATDDWLHGFSLECRRSMYFDMSSWQHIKLHMRVSPLVLHAKPRRQ